MKKLSDLRANLKYLIPNILDIWNLKENKNIDGIYKIFAKELQIIRLETSFFFRIDILSKAGTLAFSTILSLIPLLAIIFMMFKIFGGREVVNEHIKPYIYNFLTAGSSKQISSYIDSFLNSATVETLGSIGVVFLLVVVFFTLSSIEKTFNLIWNVKENRAFFDKLKLYWLMMTLSPILVTVSIALTSQLDILILKNEVTSFYSTLLVFKAVPFFLILFFFSILIKAIPNTKVYAKPAFIGAIYGTVLYYITKSIFVYYTGIVVSYNLIYGSIASLPLFMLWIYCFWILILFCVEITYIRQNFNYLKYSERNSEINYVDKVRATLLITLKMIKDYLNSKKADTVLDYSSELRIPVNHVNLCLEDMEKSGIVQVIKKNPDVYAPIIPIKDITLRRLFDSVNKMYAFDNLYNIQDYKNIISDIIDKYDLKIEDESIQKILEDNKLLVAKSDI